MEIIRSAPTKVVAIAFDWEQSLVFFSKFSEGSARESAKNVTLPSRARACSFACLACVARRTKKKGRLLVAYGRLREVSNYKVLTKTFLVCLIGVISFMELRWSLTKGGHTWSYMEVPL